MAPTTSPAAAESSTRNTAGATRKENAAISPIHSPTASRYRKRTRPITGGCGLVATRQRLTTGEAVLQAVPERHLGLAELPAEVGGLAVAPGRGIDEPQADVPQVR